MWFWSVSVTMGNGLGVRFPLAPVGLAAGSMLPTIGCLPPPGVALLTGLVPVTAFTGSEAAAAVAGRSALAVSAGKDDFAPGQNEIMSHTTDPMTRDEPPVRIASRSPARLFSCMVCIESLLFGLEFSL
jgi:hypothetical protein